MQQNQFEKFSSKDIRLILTAVAIAISSVIVAWSYFDDAFPEANIRFEVDKSTSESRAEAFLESQGLSTTRYIHASIFDYDNQAKVYLERTFGLERANELMSDEIKVWRWSHRWYQSKEKEEFQVDISPQGAVTFFDHVLEEDAGDVDLTRSKAEVLAYNFLTDELNRSATNIRFVEHASTKLPNRTDHTFTWERTDLQFNGSAYRYDVTIKGDLLGTYKEYLKIPEAWSRDYQQLRSANTTAGTVASFFLLLTGAAMLVVLIMKARLSDVKWKTALIFGVIAFVLTLGTQLNQIPLTLFNYDTTDSYGNFITQEILLSLLQALMSGGGILFLTAAAEPLYRERYGDKLSLSSAFTLQGIKTKKFFIAVVIGLVLTCFFVAYQTVFYLVSTEFGAWSPADVPYSDLLNTAVPWIFVLLMGFFPAVSEEFMSRMFSIPFLEKYIKVRWLAVLIPAFIWGFGHAAYPNQPFYIRGLEVGVAGIIIGYVMLRYGIIAALIWHYTVDALYTAFLLFRSGNAYYIMTGAVSAGIMLIPLLIAGYFYLKNGGFIQASGLTNADEGFQETPSKSGEQQKFTIEYNWVPRKRLLIGLLLAFILLGSFLLPAKNPGNIVSVKFSRSQVEDMGRKWLSTQTDSSDQYKSAATLYQTGQSQNFKYLLEHTAVDSAQSILDEFIYPTVWRVRYFQPLETEEYRVHFHPNTGEILAFQHILPESAPGDSLTESEARSLAIKYLIENEVDTSLFTVQSIEQRARPNRLDWNITLEGKDSFWATIDESRPIINMMVSGSDLGMFIRDYKLPEEWTRSRTAQTLGSTVHNFGRIAILILFGIAGVVLLIIKMREVETFRWKPTLIIGLIVALVTIAMGINRIEQVLSQYMTTMPWNQFQLVIGISLLISGIGIGGVAVLGTALSRLYYPGSLIAWKAPERYIFARDTLFTAIIAIVGFAGILHLQIWIQLQFPELAIFALDNTPSVMDSAIPAFGAIGSAFTRGLIFAVSLGLFTVLWNRYLDNPALKILTIILILLVMVPPRTLTTDEWLLQAGITLLPLLWSGFIWLFFMRDNFLSYPIIPMGLLGLQYGIQLYNQNGEMYIIQGIIVLAVFALLWFWTLADAVKHRDEVERSIKESYQE